MDIENLSNIFSSVCRKLYLESDEEIRKNVVKTSLAGKGYNSMQEVIASVSLDAVKMVAERTTLLMFQKLS